MEPTDKPHDGSGGVIYRLPHNRNIGISDPVLGRVYKVESAPCYLQIYVRVFKGFRSIDPAHPLTKNWINVLTKHVIRKLSTELGITDAEEYLRTRLPDSFASLVTNHSVDTSDTGYLQIFYLLKEG